MVAPHTRILTINVADAGVADVAGVVCRATPINTSVSRTLPFLLGAEPRSLWPRTIEGQTNEDGICRLSLVPSTLISPGWLYRLVLTKGPFEFTRMVSMPDRDDELANILLQLHPGHLLGGTTTEDVAVAADLTITGSGGQLVFQPYAGERRLVIGRTTALGEIDSLLFSDDDSRTNQQGVVTKQAGTVEVDDLEYFVWVSNQLLEQPAELTVTVD